MLIEDYIFKNNFEMMVVNDERHQNTKNPHSSRFFPRPENVSVLPVHNAINKPIDATGIATIKI